MKLTPRQRQYIELVCEGLSNPEIAARLFVSRGTVKTVLSKLYDKLEARNRTEAAVKYREKKSGDFPP